MPPLSLKDQLCHRIQEALLLYQASTITASFCRPCCCCFLDTSGQTYLCLKMGESTSSSLLTSNGVVKSNSTSEPGIVPRPTIVTSSTPGLHIVRRTCVGGEHRRSPRIKDSIQYRRAKMPSQLPDAASSHRRHTCLPATLRRRNLITGKRSCFSK